jgi:hypothetical protein
MSLVLPDRVPLLPWEKGLGDEGRLNSEKVGCYLMLIP